VAGDDGRARLHVAESLLATYTGSVEQAATSFRLGDPRLGSADLWSASRVLHGDGQVLDQLKVLRTAESGVLDGEVEGSLGLAAVASWAVPGLVLVALLVVAQVWLARRFHRILNPLLVVATVGVVVGLGVFAGHIAGARDDLRRARDGLHAQVEDQQRSADASAAAGQAELAEVIGSVCDPRDACGVTLARWASGHLAPPGTPAADIPPEALVTADPGGPLTAAAEQGDRAFLIPAAAGAAIALTVAGLGRRLAEYRFPT
jgi:hypothetical protein